MLRENEQDRKMQNDQDNDDKRKIEEILEKQERKNITHEGKPELKTDEEKIYAHGLQVLNKTGVPYAVGAALARNYYTDIWRSTKDLDVFAKPENLKAVLDAFEKAGYVTKVEERHWLSKARLGEHTIDIIFGSGNGQLQIDNTWFERCQPAEILGVKTQLLPIEEMIALAVFVATRNRFDGAEVIHLILRSEGKIDWQRILDLLDTNWELLLWHLILFDYVFPGHRDYLPQALMIQLFERVREGWEKKVEDPKAFRGTIIDPFIFAVDIEDWGYRDQRKLDPIVNEEGELL